MAAREGLVEAGHGRAAGQGVVAVGRHIDHGLKERIVAQAIGVVAIGVIGHDLIDLLGQEGFAGVFDVLLGARVGEALRQLGQDAQALVEFAQRQQSGIGDELATVESDRDLLLAEVPEGKLIRTGCGHDLKPPCRCKWIVS